MVGVHRCLRAGCPMSTYRLDKLFSPRSVALIGASPRPTSPGRAALHNLRSAGFAGAIHLINPHYDEIEGIRSVRSLDELPDAPDLIVIAAPPDAVPAIVAAAGEKGTAAAIIITSGLGHGAGSLAESCEAAARAKGLRLIGPNCLGVLVPGAKLNASFAASMPSPGDLALISQSGAIATGLVEWAASAGDRLFRHRLAGGRYRCRFRRPARPFLARSARPAPSCSMWNPSRTRASSCRPRARRRGPSPWSWSSPAAIGRAPRRP